MDNPPKADEAGVLTKHVRSLAEEISNLSPYEWLNNKWTTGNYPPLLKKIGDPAEVYVLAWLTLEVSLVIFLAGCKPAHDSPISYAILAIATYRVVNLASYQLKILLTDTKSRLQGLARSFFLALLNLAELGLATTIVVYAFGVSVIPDGLTEGLLVSTFQNDLTIDEMGSGWIAFVLALLMGAALLVAVGSLGLVIGKLAETFVTGGDGSSKD